MPLYCGIDLHSNNHVLCVIDDKDCRLLETKLDNNIQRTIETLSPYQKQLKAVAIESTFNWYWLADGLMEAGFRVELVNTAKVIQYSGLKRTNDRYDAFHLAHLMRLDILPTGYIYPKAERGLRDLLRRRIQLVQDRTRHLLRFQSQVQMHTGESVAASRIKTQKYRLPVIGDANVQLALQSQLLLIRALSAQIKQLEQSILSQVEPVASFAWLKTVPGIGGNEPETKTPIGGARSDSQAPCLIDRMRSSLRQPSLIGRQGKVNRPSIDTGASGLKPRSAPSPAPGS